MNKALFTGNVSLILTLSSFLDTVYVERASRKSMFCWVSQVTSTNWCVYMWWLFCGRCCLNRCENKCNWEELCNCFFAWVLLSAFNCVALGRPDFRISWISHGTPISRGH